MDLTSVIVLFPHCGSCDDTQGSFPFQKSIYYPDILFPTNRRMKTCKYHMIYNGATNKKYNKVKKIRIPYSGLFRKAKTFLRKWKFKMAGVDLNNVLCNLMGKEDLYFS